MSIESNTTVLRRLADEVLTGHDLAAIDEIFHADYSRTIPRLGQARAARDCANG